MATDYESNNTYEYRIMRALRRVIRAVHIHSIQLNSESENAQQRPIVKLAPLPSSAQFLNVIESVFSGMAKAVLHNSNYPTVDHCKTAIDTYIADRNKHYRQYPQRAGNKIWGKEEVEPDFKPSNNCKNRRWR